MSGDEVSGVLCELCHGYFPTSDHPCGVTLAKDLGVLIEKLNLELMERDTRPDFERGEYAGQDAMMRHLEKMDENNNSAMATAVKKSPYVQGLYRLLAQHGDSLHCASYSFGQEFDPEAAKAFHSEFCIVQKRCELWSKDLVKDG